MSTSTPTVGIYVPQVSFSREAYLERALAVEALGFDSLWMYDHLYSPGQPDRDSFEAFTLAAWVLAKTTSLRVGHLVACAGFRNAALLAKMTATLDVLSEGRFELGLGSGSVEAEHREAGLAWGSFPERSERLAETLEVLLALFTGEPVTFEGRHVTLDGFRSLPRPHQQPHPPIHIGGMGPKRTIPLVARYADVWSVPTYGLGIWEERRAQLEEACEQIGRDPGQIRISHEAVLVIGRDDAALADAVALAERRHPGAGWGVEAGGYVGTPPMLVEHLAAMRAKGVTDFVFFTPDRAAPDTLELFATEVLPHLR
jgi:alkanesulfonate monooxygenase SsuD/methylene tetrahydromethanopterin reductase-like flavin-dependent oxidoreductase (luciferase family)